MSVSDTRSSRVLVKTYVREVLTCAVNCSTALLTAADRIGLGHCRNRGRRRAARRRWPGRLDTARTRCTKARTSATGTIMSFSPCTTSMGGMSPRSARGSRSSRSGRSGQRCRSRPRAPPGSLGSPQPAAGEEQRAGFGAVLAVCARTRRSRGARRPPGRRGSRAAAADSSRSRRRNRPAGQVPDQRPRSPAVLPQTKRRGGSAAGSARWPAGPRR